MPKRRKAVLTASQIADSIRQYAERLMAVADLLDGSQTPQRKRPVRRKRTRVPLPDLDASRQERLRVLTFEPKGVETTRLTRSK